jgi:hypothetical protein
MELGVVYITTNILNGKKYIGSDSNNDKYYYGSGVNIKKALKKYGKKSFKKDILWSGPREYMREMEQYYCEYYNVEKSSLFYNATNKGVGSVKGQTHPNQWKKVHQYDLQGNFIKEYKSITEAINQTKIQNIGSCLIKNQKSAGDYLWCYSNQTPTIYSDGRFLRESKHILQYDKDKNFIKEWKSAWQASKALNLECANIRNSAEKNTFAGEYYFKYKTTL